MNIPKKNIELEEYAKCFLLKSNLSNTFSYRRAFLLGRQDALKNMESSSRISQQRELLEDFMEWFYKSNPNNSKTWRQDVVEDFLASNGD